MDEPLFVSTIFSVTEPPTDWSASNAVLPTPSSKAVSTHFIRMFSRITFVVCSSFFPFFNLWHAASIFETQGAICACSFAIAVRSAPIGVFSVR